MLILEDLYLGDVRPSERSFKRNSQYAKKSDVLRFFSRSCAFRRCRSCGRDGRQTTC